MAPSSSFPPPAPVDHHQLRFRRMRHIELNGNNIPPDIPDKLEQQTLAMSSKFGKIFAGCTHRLDVLDVSDVEALDNAFEYKNNAKDCKKISVSLPSNPTHLGVNADGTILAVALIVNNFPHIYFFDVRAFKGGQQDIKPFTEVSAFTPPKTRILSLNWNPVMPSVVAIVYSNGGMGLFMIDNEKPNSTPECCTLPPSEGITCLCWSPKGKQLVAGKRNGTLTQYKPDLKEVKTISAPSGCDFECLSIFWISTYQFLVGFKFKSDNLMTPDLYLVQSSKAGGTSYYNYGDVCFCTGDYHPFNFTMFSIQDWNNTIICTSNNSCEIGVLGQCPEAPGFTQWLFTTGGRAKFPLDSKNAEVFPTGVGIIFSSQKKLMKEGGVSTYSHGMPILFGLTETEVLCGFYIINELENAPQVTKPPQELSQSGMRPGVINIPKEGKQLTAVSSTPIKSNGQVVPPPFSTMNTPLTKPPPASLFVGSSAPFGSITNPSQLSKSLAESPKLIATPSASTAKAEAPKLTSTLSASIPKAEIFKAASTPNISSAVSSIVQEDDSLEKGNVQAIINELESFSNDLKKFKGQSNMVKISIGSHEEKTELKKKTKGMEIFSNDMEEITAQQSNGINSMHTSTLESFELVEEAKSRHLKKKDPRCRRLLKVRGLDPLNLKRFNSIQSKVLFLDQQINEANKKLDLEWKEHVQRNRGHGYRSFTESQNEVICKALMTNHGVLEAQRVKVEKLYDKAKDIRMKNICSALESTFIDGNTRPGKSSLNLSQSIVQNVGNSPRHTVTSISPMKTISPMKEANLKKQLELRGTKVIKPTRKSIEASKIMVQQGSGDNLPKSQASSEAPCLPTASPKDAFSTSFGSSSVLPSSASSINQKSDSVPVSGKSQFNLGNVTIAKLTSSTSTSSILALSGTSSAFGKVQTTAAISSLNTVYGSGTSTTKVSTPILSTTLDISKSSGTGTTAGSFKSMLGMTTTTSSLASQFATATRSSASLFATVSSSSASPFSASSSTFSFGSRAASSSKSLFASTTSSSKSIFGSATTTSSSKSIFGSVTVTSSSTFPTTTTSSFTSRFGTTASSSKSPFGTSTTSLSTSLFGATAMGSSASPPAESVPVSSQTSCLVTTSHKENSETKTTSTITSSKPKDTFSTSFGPSSILPSGVSSIHPKSDSVSVSLVKSQFKLGSATITKFTSSTPTSSILALSGTSSVFGKVQTTAAVTSLNTVSQSVHGSVTSTAKVSTPILSTISNISRGTGSSKYLFATTTTTILTSPFGAPTSTCTSSFGAAACSFLSPFSRTMTTTSSSTSVFGTPTSSSTTPFGKATSKSIFGGQVTSSVFGSTATTTSSSSIFGSPVTTSSTASVLGGASTTSGFGITAFGSSRTTLTTSSGFGSSSGITSFGSALSIGSQPSSNSTNKPKPVPSIFGGVFKSTLTTPSTLFGGSSSSPFGAPVATSSSPFAAVVTASPSSPFGAASKVSPFAPVSSSTSSGFGTAPSFGTKPSGFGVAPTFGSGTASSFESSSFGSAPTFGSSASFGGGPNFGSSSTTTQSPSSTFGGFAQQSNVPTFSSLPQQSNKPTFGSVANEGSSGFGSPAQSPSSGGFGKPSSPFSSSSPPTSSPSFSSWR